MSFFKVILPLIFWGIFILVIFLVPYPETLTQADTDQLLKFFIPLYFALILTFNIFLRNIFIACSISLGVIALLIIKALDSLNLVTSLLIIIAVYLLISYFRKRGKESLTNLSKIPKLTHMRKHYE